jgi:sporulation protein YlmC with PRC-barrel domain
MRTQPEALLGARVTGSDGKVIGTVEQVFRDDVDGTPTWARVRSGKTARFVPLGNSQVTADGLSVPFDSPKVMNGPSIEAGQHMSATQAEELSRYYGLLIPPQQAPAPGEQAPPGQQAPSQQVPAQQAPSQEGLAQEVPSQQGAGMPAGQDAAYARTADRDSGGDVTVRTQAEQLLGARVTGSDGRVIGTVEQVFRDDVDGTPAWARVRSGQTGRFVPLGTSQVTGEGLRVPFDSPKVMNGPDIEEGQHMSAAQCEELSRYYGLAIPGQQVPREQAPGQQAPSREVPSQQAAGIPADQGRGDVIRTQAEQLLGVRVTGSDGKVIGTFEQVFRDDVDGTPAWGRIRSGQTSRFAPLGTSQVAGEGLSIPFDSVKVMNSPVIEEGQHLSATQCDELSRYYGLTIPG